MALNDTVESPFGASEPARVALLYNPKVRSIVFQAALVLALIVIVAWFVDNTIDNLRRTRITSGFGFLWRRAGFAIGDSWIVFTPDSSNLRAFVVGILNTLRVAVIGVFFATILGFLIGIMRLSSNWLVAKFATVYVEIIRNVPLLLWLLFLYKAVLSVLPVPRNAIIFPLGTALSNRGLMIPNALHGEWRSGVLPGCRDRDRACDWRCALGEATGAWRPVSGFPTLRTNLAILIGLPLVVYIAAGTNFALDLPELKGFNFSGGLQYPPGVSGARRRTHASTPPPSSPKSSAPAFSPSATGRRRRRFRLDCGAAACCALSSFRRRSASSSRRSPAST